MERTASGVVLEVAACKCKSQFCPDCRVGVSVKLRERLREPAKEFRRFLLVTLTIDQKRWRSPEEVYLHVQGNRMIAEMMRKLDRENALYSRKYFYVIEFHKKGEGWPHWHLVIDAQYINDGYLEELWGLGFVDVNGGHDGWNYDRAVNYLTKYLTKEESYPKWVLDMPGNFRRFSCSRGLLGMSHRKQVEESGDKSERRRRSVRERVAECKTTTNVFRIDEAGERYFLVNLHVPYRVVKDMSPAQLRKAIWDQCDADDDRTRERRESSRTSLAKLFRSTPRSIRRSSLPVVGLPGQPEVTRFGRGVKRDRNIFVLDPQWLLLPIEGNRDGLEDDTDYPW